MKRILLSLLPALAVMSLVFACEAASIIWGASVPATDCSGTPLEGIRAFGPVDLSNGDLIQLIKAVGEVDNPFTGGVPDGSYWSSPDYVVDDIILDEVHAGYGIGPPGAPAGGLWSRTTEVDIAVGDTLYARAYSDSKDTFGMASEIGVGAMPGTIVSNPVEFVDRPVTYLFDGIGMAMIPEPSPLLLLVPGLALWRLTRKKWLWQ